MKKKIMKKEFIVRPQNDGKVFGREWLKVYMSDELLNRSGNENLSLALSVTEGFRFEKDSRFKVTIEQVK